MKMLLFAPLVGFLLSVSNAIAKDVTSCPVPKPRTYIKDVRGDALLLSRESEGSSVYLVTRGFAGEEMLYSIIQVRPPECREKQLVTEWFDGKENRMWSAMNIACVTVNVEQDKKSATCYRDDKSLKDAKSVYRLDGDKLRLLSSHYSMLDHNSGKRITINYPSSVN